MAYTPKILPGPIHGDVFEAITSITVLNTQGATAQVGTPTVTVTRVDDAGNVLEAYGTAVPTDGDAGYSVGALFRVTTGGVGTTLYLNEGSTTVADFNAITTA